MGFTAFLAQTSPCFQYMFNPLLATHWAPCHCCTLTHSCSPISHIFSFQHFTLSTRFHLSTLLLRFASPFKLPSRGQLLWHGARKCMEKERLFTVSTSFPAHSNVPVCLCTSHTNLAGLSTPLNLGIHVKKCWFLLSQQGKNTSGEQSEAAKLESEVLPYFSMVDHMLKRPPFLPVGQGRGKGEAEEASDKGVPMCLYPNATGLKSHSNLRKQEQDSATPGIP